ncbi:MAG: hypothetical protein MJK15_05225 [Colwellia sp.]|nr:hypothetical protein [Colwellia sp.]
MNIAAMDNISGFVSQWDEIARLNKQLSMVAEFYDNFYKNKIKTLTKERNDIKNKHTKLKAAKRKGKPSNFAQIKATLWSRAFGVSKLTNIEIANKYLSTLATVRRISIEVNNERPVNNIN